MSDTSARRGARLVGILGLLIVLGAGCWRSSGQHSSTAAVTPVVTNVQLVRLFDARRLDLLACDMSGGFVMALKPYEAQPRWQVLGKVLHPAHAEVVDLDGDGIQDILVANLGSFQPTD